MPDRVADASLLGAVVFGEPRADEAASLLQGVALYGPTLLPYELCSIARKKILQLPEQREAVLQSLEMALSLNIRWVEVDQLQVASLALETGLTVYDASYLYVARSLGIPLITFDRQLQAAAGLTGLDPA